MQRILCLLVALIATLLIPAAAAAQGKTETVVIQIDGTTPFGNHMIGTVVLKRDCGSSNNIRSTASFNGMMNGRPVAFSGTMIERWLGNGREEIEVLATDITGTVNGRPPLGTLQIVQTGPNAVTVAGIPAAINGSLEPPCSGRTSYVATNAGQGSTQITRLPNASSAVAPEQAQAGLPLIAALMGLTAGLGAALLIRRKGKATP